MKTLCLKTEEQFKYLTTHLFDDGWYVDITEKGTTLNNNQLNQNVFILDMNTTNTELIEITKPLPEDWSPRVYFYNTQYQTWEKGQVEVENNQNDNSTT